MEATRVVFLEEDRNSEILGYQWRYHLSGRAKWTISTDAHADMTIHVKNRSSPASLNSPLHLLQRHYSLLGGQVFGGDAAKFRQIIDDFRFRFDVGFEERSQILIDDGDVSQLQRFSLR